MPGDEAQPRNAVGVIGRIEPFEDTVETWTSYTERLEQYFEVNDIAEDKKVPALLTLLGGKTYTFFFLLLLLWLRKTINVLMFTFRRMPGKMFSNL